MVELAGVEPATSSMPLKRAPNCATAPRRPDFFIFRHLSHACKLNSMPIRLRNLPPVSSEQPFRAQPHFFRHAIL